MKPIRVLIIDDSALVRKLLTEILGSDPAIEVCGTAIDANSARKKIKRLKPDVLTLDVEMPGMDGLTFLRNLMRLHPLPVIMISSMTERGAEVTEEALELGALDFVSKPKFDIVHSFRDYGEEITQKVRMAATAHLSARGLRQGVSGKGHGQVSRKKMTDMQPDKASLDDLLILIGASTGGTEAIKEILQALPASMPPILITQHIPPVFSASFASRMNSSSELSVCEAVHGQRIAPGHVYIAPGNRHLCIGRDKSGYFCQLADGPPVNRHLPSVDILFRSAANSAGGDAIGVLLTGMGNDGAAGLRKLRDAGAKTIVQDENTSVVWGMPGAAVELGAAEYILPLGRIASRLMSLLRADATAEKKEVAGLSVKSK